MSQQVESKEEEPQQVFGAVSCEKEAVVECQVQPPPPKPLLQRKRKIAFTEEEEAREMAFLSRFRRRWTPTPGGTPSSRRSFFSSTPLTEADLEALIW